MAAPISAADVPTSDATGLDMKLAVSVQVRDLDIALKFYLDGLGMIRRQTFLHPARTNPDGTQHGGDTTVAVAFAGGNEPVIYLAEPNNKDAPFLKRGTMSRLILLTNNIQAVEARILAAGFKMTSPVRPAGPAQNVLVGFLNDPDGNMIELVQKKLSEQCGSEGGVC